jgi:hypothetical protein
VPEPPDRQFRLPGRQRDPWWLWLLVILLHMPLVAFVLIEFHRHGMATSPPGKQLTEATSSARGIPFETAPSAPLSGGGPVRPRPGPPARPAADTLTSAPAAASGAASPPPAPQPAGAAAPDTGGKAAGGAVPYLEPAYAGGKVWVKPLPMTPREITEALTGKSRAQIDDSIVNRIVQTYLDEMAREHSINLQNPPSWTTTIGGQKVGVDQRWIYLGSIRIPAALLALLPIHLQANPTAYEFNQRLQQMRDDLFEAARRSASYDDFKEAVKELRAETQRQRDFDKAQRTAPADTNRH